MTTRPSLIAHVDALKIGVVERVVAMLENKWAIGQMNLGAQVPEDLANRLKALRGKIHNCDPGDWVNAPYGGPELLR